MKRLLLLLILLAAGWYAYGWLKERATPDNIRELEKGLKQDQVRP